MYVIGLHMETCFKFYIGSIFRIVSLLDPFFGVFLWISLLSIYKMFLVNFNNRVVLGFVDLAMCINIYRNSICLLTICICCPILLTLFAPLISFTVK